MSYMSDTYHVLQNKLAQIAEMHRKVRFAVCDTGPRCELCDTDWPCPTIAIIGDDGTYTSPST
jgi:hypothetical protein